MKSSKLFTIEIIELFFFNIGTYSDDEIHDCPNGPESWSSANKVKIERLW